MVKNNRDFSIIKKNILLYLENHSISKYEFYQKTGVSNGVLSQKGGLSEENLLKFLSYYTDVDLEWLLTGEGDMLRDVTDPVATRAPQPQKGIPLIPAHAEAGVFSGEINVMELDCERYVVPVFKDAEFLIYVKGLSMQPTFRSGDIVACKKLPLDTFFQWNKVYVLDTDQGALIKRIKKSAKENFVLVVSDNDKYDPFELSLKKIYSIALVIGVIRLE
jgi:phage repressor protein C with HTH and peptisase S24 domain